MEHRGGERIPLTRLADLRTSDGRTLRVILRNLSCGGAFLALPAGAKAPRGPVELALRLPYAQPLACRWRGSVVHEAGDGIGVKFADGHLHELLPYLAAEKIALRAQPGRATAPASRERRLDDGARPHSSDARESA